MQNAKYLEVDARPRYWEDANVNGIYDTDGTLIPCRVGDSFKPIIDLDEGKIINWTIGIAADIHYKVCDNGDYWLLDADKVRIAEREDNYVPCDFLCFGDEGDSDYIIMKVQPDGTIEDYVKPTRFELFEPIV